MLRNIRKELRPYAAVYEKIVGEHPSEKSIRWTSAACDRLLKGRWIGHKTEAHEVWIRRQDHTLLRSLAVVKKDQRHDACQQATGLLWMHGGGYAVGVPEIC